MRAIRGHRQDAPALQGRLIMVCMADCKLLRLDDALYRADLHTLRRIKMALALDAEFGVDNIDVVSLTDRLDRALGLASATGDALIGDLHRHSWFSSQ